jgi:hypothetical protein
MRRILGRCAISIKNWRLPVKSEVGDLELWTEELDKRSARPPQITWDPRGSEKRQA